MKKILILALVIVLGTALFVGCTNDDNGDEMYLIGLMQIAPHPALDAAREGFIAGLAEEGFVEGENVRFRALNANGDATTLNLMAQQIVDEDPSLILSIATPTSVALRTVTQEIPIVITAVTDPLRAGLIESFEVPGTNVTGTSDRTPVARQFEFITRVLPEAQTVGILYNSGEINAVIQADWAEEAALELGLTPRRFAVAAAADVMQVAETAAGLVDAIYLPTCNVMAQAYVTVVMAADGAGIPVIAGESGGVEQGALATEGVNYFELGRQSARMAAQILRGEATPQTMPIEWQTEYAIAINLATADRLEIEIPDDILGVANMIIEN